MLFSHFNWAFGSFQKLLLWWRHSGFLWNFQKCQRHDCDRLFLRFETKCLLTKYSKFSRNFSQSPNFSLKMLSYRVKTTCYIILLVIFNPQNHVNLNLPQRAISLKMFWSPVKFIKELRRKCYLCNPFNMFLKLKFTQQQQSHFKPFKQTFFSTPGKTNREIALNSFTAFTSTLFPFFPEENHQHDGRNKQRQIKCNIKLHFFLTAHKDWT